ncbi:hypothetical protein IQ07DRAFT_299788 [Pyrenochaeta sp. DS3sAY3a]|nr:hypothetical protein IQ07DRAFT_299788 [Pyrenochaeta sp. DS3sAY3a]
MTPEVLPRLRRLNPEIAAKLVEKDALKQIPFKLITTNQFWTPTDIHSFVAISYCWHSREWEVPSRFNCDQQDWDFPISPAMLNAILLRCIVNSSTTSQFAMWIDQICINQENADEKFHAIANLDVIYRNATEINILLEDVNISSEEESTLRLLSAEEDECGPYRSFNIGEFEMSTAEDSVNAGYGDALFSVITKVFDSRWFGRAWCRHEYMLNLNATFIVIGRQFACITFDPSAFAEVHFQLTKNGVEIPDLSLMSAFQDFSFGINDPIRDYTIDGCLFELFVQLQLLNCSYEKDIISISLNASGIRLSFNGDVARQRECRYILAMIALSAGDASVLGAEGLPMHRMDVPGHQPLLHWPREYESDWSRLAAQSMPRICDDAKIWAINSERVSLDTFFLLSRPSMPPKEFMESATELSLSLGIKRDTREDIKTKIYADILSCVFSFGLRWIEMASDYFKGLWPEFKNIDEVRYQTIKSTIIRHCLSNEDSMSPQDFPNSACIAQFIYHLRGFARWFANVDETTPLTMSLNSAGTGRAILLVPTCLAREVSCGKYYIAVPVALNTMKAFSVRRVWILEAAKTDGAELALVGRGFFIAERALNTEEHDEVYYGRQVTIVGQWRDDQFREDDSSFEQWDTESG